MTTKITPSAPTGPSHTDSISLSHIDCVPLWDLKGEEVILFDMWTKDKQWLGSKRLFKYCLQFNKEQNARI